MTPPKCACCAKLVDLQRVKLTWLCRGCVVDFVTAFARAR